MRPLTSTDYVAGRWLAFFTIVLALVYSGQIVLFVGLTLAAGEPLTYVRENWLDIPRFLAAGAVIAVFTTTIPLAVSGFTNRRAYAAGFVIGLFILSAAVANSLTGCTEREVVVENGELVVDRCEAVSGRWAKWVALAELGAVPANVSDIIFGETPDSSQADRHVSELHDAIPVAWYVVLTMGPAVLLLWRYRKEAR